MKIELYVEGPRPDWPGKEMKAVDPLLILKIDRVQESSVKILVVDIRHARVGIGWEWEFLLKNWFVGVENFVVTLHVR